MPDNVIRTQKAIEDFQAARQRAGLQEVLARITGRSTELLSYEEVAEKFKLRGRVERGLHDIPIDAIIGSVGRYTDFTRSFLPRLANDRERWVNVKTAMEDGPGLPPIDVYKVGDAYFVIDGNHRVSIARQEGFSRIQARVIEMQTNVPLSPDDQPDDLIIKSEYATFLDATKIMDLRPNVDLSVTVASQYQKLMEEICEQECLLEHEHKADIPFQTAVETWYDNKYLPIAEAIRNRGLLHWFPGRTITDLYIWIAKNRSALEAESGWEIQSDAVATDLILDRSVRSEPGSWRKARTANRYTDHLLMDLLVPLSGYSDSWDVLDQAIVIAKREEAAIHGLHIVDTKEKISGPAAIAVQLEFEQRCAAANLKGRLAIEVGDITKKIVERATATDLIVLKVSHPPASGLASLRSPFQTIVANSSRPLLGVPAQATEFQRALLAFDGSDQSKEALFVATYLAEMWKTQLIVFSTPGSTKDGADATEYIRRYLDLHEVEAEFIFSDNNAMECLKQSADAKGADLVLMGSYNQNIFERVFAGSALDYMLRESKVPVFICQ